MKLFNLVVVSLGLSLIGFGIISCASTPEFQVAEDSAKPAGRISSRGKAIDLEGQGGWDTGDKFPSSEVVTANMQDGSLPTKGKVRIISVVPSIDTLVCEQQTHLLGETKKLKPGIERVTISMDLPMAQKRFAKEAKLENITYFSDFKKKTFGQQTGLLMKGSGLLARAVIVLDEAGKVRYFQITPDVAQMPDMDRAFEEANKLMK